VAPHDPHVAASRGFFAAGALLIIWNASLVFCMWSECNLAKLKMLFEV
jgi:hypothetical protein